jgi:hypothetical protein
MLLWAGTVYAAEYEPIKFGSFLLTPKLTIEQSYDDNIFASEDDEETDFVTALKPSLLVEKSYRDHQFAFEAEGEARKYWDHSDEDVINFKSEFRGRAVPRRALTLPFKISYEKGHLDRTDERGSLTREPTGFMKLKTEIGTEYAPNRLTLGVYGGFNQTRFDNGETFGGAEVIRDDGDFNTVYGRGVVKYSTGTEWTPFMSLMYGENTYKNGSSRDNNVLRAMAGAEVAYHDLLKGSAAFGHDWRSYDAAGADDVRAFSAEGSLQLKLKPRMTFKLDFLRQSEEDNVVNDGIVETEIHLRNAYELKHNLFLNTGTQWRNTKFEDTDRTDNTYGGTIGISYILNRRFEVGGEYLHRWRDSTAAGSDFEGNIFMLRLTGKL